MNSTAKKVWNVITTVLVVLVVILAVLLVGARIFGLRVFYVLSPSMEPAYHVGSLIYVKKTDPAEIKVGDPITFVLLENEATGKKTVATHRVVRIEDLGVKDVEGAGKMHCWDFYTKGDANKTEDGEPVFSPNLLGKPVFTIPVLGYVAHFVQNPPGIYIAVAAGAVLLLLVFLPDLISGKKKKEEAKNAVPVVNAETQSPAAEKTAKTEDFASVEKTIEIDDPFPAENAETENPAPVDKNGE